MSEAATFDAIEVLAEAGAARDAFCAAIGEVEGDDAGLVRALLATIAPGVARAPVRELARLAAIVRALEACVSGRIEVDDVRGGLRARAAETDGFVRLGPARVLLRTVDDVLAQDGLAPHRVRSQLGVFHRQLLALLREQLTGVAEAGVPVVAADLRAPAVVPSGARLVRDDGEAARLDQVARDCLLGPDGYGGGGIRAYAWVRGWMAVPVPGGAFGEDPREAARLVATLQGARPTATPDSDPSRDADAARTVDRAIAQVRREARSRYELDGVRVTVGAGRREALVVPPGLDALRAVLDRPRGRCLYLPADTTPGRDDACGFAIVEDDEYHVVAGPRAFVESVCGCSRAEALGRFRELVESLVVDDEEPEELAAVARAYGQMRRRAGT